MQHFHKYQGEKICIALFLFFPFAMVLCHWVSLAKFLIRQCHQTYYKNDILSYFITWIVNECYEYIIMIDYQNSQFSYIYIYITYICINGISHIYSGSCNCSIQINNNEFFYSTFFLSRIFVLMVLAIIFCSYLYILCMVNIKPLFHNKRHIQ